jgi:hypothetical protein
MKLLEELKETLPNLVGMSLDLARLAMHSESASARKRTAGSATLCTCLAEFGHSKSMPPPATWGAFFTGAEDGQLSAREHVLRSQVMDGSMAQSKARKILDCLGKRQSRTALDGSSTICVSGVGFQKRTICFCQLGQLRMKACTQRSTTGFVKRRTFTRAHLPSS